MPLKNLEEWLWHRICAQPSWKFPTLLTKEAFQTKQFLILDLDKDKDKDKDSWERQRSTIRPKRRL